MESTTNSDERVYLYIHTTSSELLNAYKDSSNFIHYAQDSPFRQIMTVELIVDGIIFIFKNLQAFEFLHQPIPKTFFSTNIVPPPAILAEKFEPVILKCELIHISSSVAYSIMSLYFHSIHPKIQLNLTNNQIFIELSCPEILARYEWIIQGGLEKLNNFR